MGNRSLATPAGDQPALTGRKAWHMNSKLATTGPGGFPTFSGMAFGRNVTWLANNGERAREHESRVASCSRLLALLIVNAYTMEGLTEVEFKEAGRLIATEPEAKEKCLEGHGQAIGDTGNCSGCNVYALASRK